MEKDTLNFLDKYNKLNNRSLNILDKEIQSQKKKGNHFKYKNLVKVKEVLVESGRDKISKIQKQINEISKILRNNIYGLIGLSFSGSILKETYVFGFGDIDIFVLFDKDLINKIKPKTIQTKIIILLKKYISNQKIKKNKEAVDFFEGDVKLQIVPVLCKRQEIFFPNHSGEGWKNINPDLFANLLKKEDKKTEGKLTTSIKIIKLILSRFPKKYKITGHHIEVLSYLSSKNIKEDERIPLLNLVSNILFEASNKIMAPTKDSSKQFNFVDEYLGKKESLKRKNISKKLREISERLNKEELEI